MNKSPKKHKKYQSTQIKQKYQSLLIQTQMMKKNLKKYQNLLQKKYQSAALTYSPERQGKVSNVDIGHQTRQANVIITKKVNPF